MMRQGRSPSRPATPPTPSSAPKPIPRIRRSGSGTSWPRLTRKTPVPPRTAIRPRRPPGVRRRLHCGPLRPDGTEYFSRLLLTEKYVCVMDPLHPLASKPLTLEEYCAASHVTVTYGGAWRSRYLLELDAMGRTLNHALLVPSPAGLDDMVRGTGLVATVPRRIAMTFGPGVHVSDCPLHATVSIHLVWTTRTHRTAMYGWMREQIVSSVSERIAQEVRAAAL